MKINNLELQQLISSSEEELREITGGHQGKDGGNYHEVPGGYFFNCISPVDVLGVGPLHPNCYPLDNPWWHKDH